MNFPVLTTKQKNRDASGAIRGYLYQFEMTALEIFNSGEATVARVEGVEDLDKLESGDLTAIQIKYWSSKSSITNRAIAEPLFDMFESYVSDQSLKFQLYVYVSGATSEEKSLTADDVVEAFTSSEVVGKVDQELANFYEDFSKTVRIIPGPNIIEQRKNLARVIVAEIGCDESEAYELHLPRVVHFINRIACNSCESERLVKRQDLVQILTTREYYYSKWHAEYADQEKVIRQSVRWLRDAGFSEIDKRRVVGISLMSSEVPQALELVKILTDEKRRGQSLTKKLPWTIVLNAGDSDAGVLLKRRLLEETSISFNDGFESLSFSPDRFIYPPVINTNRGGNLITRASYSVRIISLENYLSLAVCQREKIASRSCWFDSQPIEFKGDGLEHVVLNGLKLADVNKIMRKVLQ